MKKFAYIFIFLLWAFLITGCTYTNSEVTPTVFTDGIENFGTTGYSSAYIYEPQLLNSSYDFLYHDICFESEDILPENVYQFTAKAVACYDIDKGQMLLSKDIYNKVYPASITKLLTAYLAILYLDMDEEVVISEDNCGITLAGAQVCGFKAGDRITVKDLMYCLLVFSGNDAAIAIAEKVSGSESKFVELMNSTAKQLGAIDTHFTNSHGLNDPNHYTTAYDMYLVFNECLKNDFFVSVISTQGYDVTITGADGTNRTFYLEPTNMYFQGKYAAPESVYVFGGKTGSTIAAGYCLILYVSGADGSRYITEIFGCEDRTGLYTEMNEVLELCN